MLLHVCVTRPPWCICYVYTMVYMYCNHMNTNLCVVYASRSICHVCSMMYMLCMCETCVTYPPWCICSVYGMEYNMWCILMCPTVYVIYTFRCACHTCTREYMLCINIHSAYNRFQLCIWSNKSYLSLFANIGWKKKSSTSAIPDYAHSYKSGIWPFF